MVVTIPMSVFKDEMPSPAILEAMFDNAGKSALDLLQEEGADMAQEHVVVLHWKPLEREG